MTMHDDDSQNPYRATIIDEKSVEATEFFRAEPQYRKLVRGSLGRIGYAVFMQHKWRFIGLGASNILLLLSLCASIALLLVLVQGRQFLWLQVIVVALVILLSVTYANVSSIYVALRILRKEKSPSLCTSRDETQFFVWNWLHTSIYMVSWLGLLILLLAPFLGIGVALDNSNIRLSDAVLAFAVILGVIVFIAWAIVVIVPMTRLFYGVHFIIDRRMNCLAAARASWRHTRGNILAVTFKDHGLGTRQYTLMAFAYLTLGVVLIGYAYCEVTVTYLILTGQCDLLEQQPDEW